MSRVQKCRVYTPMGDGTYLQRDFQIQAATLLGKLRGTSSKPIKAACLMLNICSIASLEAYAKQVEKLTTQWPRCWGLIYLADDSGRAERLEKIRRKLTIESAQNRQVPREWDPNCPWSCVFVQLAMDTDFCAERIHHPAAAWTASGGKGAPCVAAEAAVFDATQGGQRALGLEQELSQTSDRRKTQANRDRRQAKKRRLASDRSELARHRAATPSSGKGAGGAKGKAKGKSKDQSGLELCYSWASGKRHCADVAPGGECKGPVKRIHKCRICLSPSHKDADCRSG